MKTPYETLGVPKNASADEIKKAYRKLAMDYHPDRNPGDKTAEHKFREINEAYDVLKDADRRAAYDRFGHAGVEGGAAHAQPGGFDFATGFADIFDEMFGEFVGGRRRSATGGMRGADLRYNLQVTLEEAYAGKQATIRVPTSVMCEACSGSGGEKGGYLGNGSGTLTLGSVSAAQAGDYTADQIGDGGGKVVMTAAERTTLASISFPAKVIPLAGTASSADNAAIRAAIAAIKESGQPGVIDALVAEGVPEKVAYAKVLHMVKRRLLDYGVSPYYAWPA